jgi:hypothetical protein
MTTSNQRKWVQGSVLATMGAALCALGCDNTALVGAQDAGLPPTTTGAGQSSAGGKTGGTGTAGSSSTGSGGVAGTTSVPVGGELLQISGLEAITRIAAVVWNASPDGDVLVQAEQGHLTTKNDLFGPIHTMLADPRAATGVGKFYRWWLNLDAIATTSKDAQMFPAYTPALQVDIANETETFALTVTLKMNGTYTTLLTSPSTFVNARLAAIYGVPGISGDALQATALDPSQRAGLLTQPGLQALVSLPTRNSPARRGVYVEERFLCSPVPAGPTTLPALAPPQPGTTLRVAIMQDEASASCAACHVRIDGPGFAFETFDAIGRWRTNDNGAPVDVSGLLLYDETLTAPTHFAGPIQLANDLAASVRAQQCLARQWLAFVGGTTFDQIDDATVAPIYATFKASNFNLQELIVAVLTSDGFLAKH